MLVIASVPRRQTSHRTAEWFGLEGAFKGGVVQPCCPGQGQLSPQIRLPKAPSFLTVNTSSDEASTAALRNLFQLDTELLTATLWMQPSSQFLSHQIIHPSNPHLSNIKTRMWHGTMSEASQRSRQMTTIAPPFSANAVTPL